LNGVAREVEQPEGDERHDHHDEGGLQDAAEDEGQHKENPAMPGAVAGSSGLRAAIP
jgi:hypothetical protein